MLSDIIRAKRIPTVRFSPIVVLLDMNEIEKFIREHSTYEIPPPPYVPPRKHKKALAKNPMRGRQDI